jgi:hypothetical protein
MKKKVAVLDTGAATLFGWLLLTFFCWGLLGVMAVTILWLLHAPWITVGQYLVSDESPIWGAGLVFQAPVIGPWISEQMMAPVSWVATVAMTLINSIQVLAILQRTGYLTLKNHWIEMLSLFAIGSWMIELWVALTQYNVYDGGMAGFMIDLPLPTLAYWNWGEIASVIFLMFVFEASIYLGAIAILALKHNKGVTKARAKAAGGT